MSAAEAKKSCTHHRVKLSDEFECQKEIDGVSPNKEDILLNSLHEKIQFLKSKIGLEDSSDHSSPPQESTASFPCDPLPKAPAPVCPAKILCAHRTGDNQLLIHWIPTARCLPIAGYEVRTQHNPFLTANSPLSFTD